MPENKWKVTNVSQQPFINEVCTAYFTSGYASSRSIGEEGYIYRAYTDGERYKDLYYMTVLPTNTHIDDFEWWDDGSARHLYHISELESIELEQKESDLELLLWIESGVKMTQLNLVSIYKDGGSERYVDKDGNEYWRCFKFGQDEHKGKLFVGNINDEPYQLATGDFVLVEFNRMPNERRTNISQR